MTGDATPLPAFRRMSFFGASRRVFDLSLGEMLWSRRTIFMALVVGGPVLLALIVKASRDRSACRRCASTARGSPASAFSA